MRIFFSRIFQGMNLIQSPLKSNQNKIHFRRLIKHLKSLLSNSKNQKKVKNRTQVITTTIITMKCFKEILNLNLIILWKKIRKIRRKKMISQNNKVKTEQLINSFNLIILMICQQLNLFLLVYFHKYFIYLLDEQ